MSLESSRNQDASTDANREPWPLATDATFRVLAWPRYEDTESIKRVLRVAEPLFDNQSGCLCLRHDPEYDIPYQDAVHQLERAFEELGLTGDLEVLFVNEAIEESDLSRLGHSIQAMIQADEVLNVHQQSLVNALLKADVAIIGADL